VSQATTATVAGRPQPQTTAQPQGGPFIRHAPDGRRSQYVVAAANALWGGFISQPTVSMPGYCKGYRIQFYASGGTGSSVVLATDFPYSLASLVQMKDAFGTQLLTGPGYEILGLVPLYSGQFGTDLMRSSWNSPQFSAGTTAGNFQVATYVPFEFAKAYGTISGANAALLPVLQMNIAASSAVYSTLSTAPTGVQVTVDSDFYWLPNAPTDPPGLGTTQQWIYQQATPIIASTGTTSTSQLVQFPRLGGYLTTLIMELRDSAGARMTTDSPVAGYAGTTAGNGWPQRPKLLVDGVPLVDTLWGTWCEDLAIATGIGATAATTNAAAGTVPVARPTGTFAINRKTSLSQRDFGLLDTGEIFLSTNPGTQIEVAGYPWGYSNSSTNYMTLNAIVGQVVPTGALVQGLPEV
jgi:hypothetical protein